MYLRCLIITILSGLALRAPAQSAMLQMKVTFSYQQISLGEALADISENYQLKFSYSRDFIPVNQKISIRVFNESLTTGLDQLFESTKVVYAIIGDQIVLRIDRDKPVLRPIREETYGSTNSHSRDEDNQSLSADVGSVSSTDESLPPILSEDTESVEEVPLGTDEAEPELVHVDTELSNRSLRKRRNRAAQVSLIPYVGTNMEESDQLTNNFSLNILVGRNGGVNGVEIGGLGNSLKNDMIGVQVAGLANSVQGIVHGTQVAGLFNYAGAYATGAQVAGVFNYARSGNLAQVAGFFNTSSGDLTGSQVAGIGNIVDGDAEAVQVAGTFNYTTGRSRLQLSGLFNKAEDVQEGQIAGLLNIGKRVGGFQIGLINICDTISGVPLGLINIVRKGYNRWEWSGGEALHINSSFKFGARSFYNILYLGMRIENGVPIADRDDKISWGIGYGIGTAVATGKRSLVNFELLSIHINERETFTRTLNLLNQFSITNDVQMGDSPVSLFFGPTFNVLFSRLFDPDSQTYGSAIAPYDLYNKSRNNTNTRMWIGGKVGLRF